MPQNSLKTKPSHYCHAFRIVGIPNIDGLKRALVTVIERHSAERTLVDRDDAGLIQIVKDHPDFNLPVIDLCSLGLAEQKAHIERRVQQDTKRPFDLSNDFILRGLLFKLSNEEYVLSLSIRHFAFYGWSASILWREIEHFYNRYSQSQSVELPVNDADLAVWQRTQLCGDRLEMLLDYWRHQLNGMTSLELPSDRTRRPTGDLGVDTFRFKVPASLHARLKKLCHGAQVPLKVCCLAAFQVLLARYSDSEDIAIGTPISLHDDLRSNDLIGCFRNLLVIRSDLSGNPSFRRILRRVRETSDAAYEHRDLPFEMLVENVKHRFEESCNPLLQVVFQLAQASPSQLRLPGLEVEPLSTKVIQASFDLEIYLAEQANGLDGTVIFNADVYDLSTIERMIGHYLTILTAVVNDIDQNLRSLPLMTERERQRILVEWNDTTVVFPHDKCIHELFEDQAKNSPGAIAVIFKDEKLTYRELDNLANNISAKLIELGIGRNQFVGIHLERSAELVAAIIGVLKSGGAFVPLDPDLPNGRLEHMVRDAQLSVIISSKDELRADLFNARAAILDVAEVWNDSPEPQLSAYKANQSNYAYMFYTSGSTGNPKGVINNHRGIANRLNWMIEAFDVDHEDAILQKTAFGFDVSIWEFFLPLLVGGKLVVARPGGHKDPQYLKNIIRAESISIIHFVPSMLELALDVNMLKTCESLRCVICSGEPLRIEHVKRFYQQIPMGDLHNLYGPTEAAIDVSWWACEKEFEENVVPIGRPISNTRLYILDEQMNPVPAGIRGELFIGGCQVAVGYCNQPEKTAECFLVDPFTPDAQATMYRTGDVARFLPDGNIEFLGRKDRQVKLRGMRVELGEIERSLINLDGTVQAVVVPYAESGGETKLVAYVVRNAGASELTIDNLRLQLRDTLPEHMIPSLVLPIDKIPLNTNGKINYDALPVPDISVSGRSSQFVSPSTTTESRLCTLCETILDHRPIGVNDRFLDLGANSLTMIRIKYRVLSELDTELSIQELFDVPTVGELARKIEQRQKLGNPNSHSPLVKFDQEPNAKVSSSHEQYRIWVHEKTLSGSVAYNIPYAIRLVGAVDHQALEYAFRRIIVRHAPLRTKFSFDDGRLVQIVRDDFIFVLTQVDLRTFNHETQQREVDRLIHEEAENPFDLERDLMLRASLLTLSGQEYVLMMTFHHIAFDGWSQSILWRELETLYDDNIRSAEILLPELSVTYADYAIWQHAQYSSERLDSLLAHWLPRLQGMKYLELPSKCVQSAQPLKPAEVVRFQVSPEVIERLEQISQSEEASLQMCCLAVFKILLSRYSGLTDLSVGIPIQGRQDTQLENLIGFFVNILVLRTDLTGNPTFRQFLQRIRTNSLDAYEHQDLPFDKLVEALRKEGKADKVPLIQVIFQLMDFSDAQLSLPGMIAETIPTNVVQAKFDLELHLTKRSSGLDGEFVYRSDLFETSTIERMAGHFLTLLTAIVRNADEKIQSLPLLTKPERHQLLGEWNDTKTNYPRDMCIHELFEEQVNKTPNAVAVVFDNQTLTYRELNERANQLCRRLMNVGVEPDSIVGLYLEHSPELLIGMLGILKAGGAYLPLDIDEPRQRLEFMLQDAKVTSLVTRQTLVANPNDLHCTPVFIDDDINPGRSSQAAFEVADVQASNLAYVIYTSGSTGQPKGVEVTHRGVTRLVCNSNYADFDSMCVLLLAPASFDASTFEIWAPLLNGGRCIGFPDRVPAPDKLGAIIDAQGVNTLWLTSSLFNTIIDQRPDVLSGVTQLLTGGEALSVPHVRKAVQALPDTELINGYGPTEGTTFTCCWRIKDLDPDATSVPIGMPIANTQVYILDSNRSPVPIGVVGELYVGGDGLARGYLNDAKLTSSRFIDNPLDSRNNSKLYKTGDLACWRNDGTIDFHGRVDSQIKLRGFRIEPGEIEAILNGHSSVSQSVVHLDRKGVLKAYVVPQPDMDLSTLSSHLEKHLPQYMVPRSIIQVDRFPLTVSGKIDRRKLHELLGKRISYQQTEYVAPRNPTEVQIAEIWKEILGLDQVGVHDNFFELGGHSLLVVRMVDMANRKCSGRLSIAFVYRYPTIATIANHLDTDARNHSTRFLNVLKVGGNAGTVVCVGMGLTEVARYVADQTRVVSFDLDGVHSTPYLGLTLSEQASAYAVELFDDTPPFPMILIGFSYGGLLAYATAHYLLAKGCDQFRLVLIEPSSKMALENTIPLSLRLKRLARVDLKIRASINQRRVGKGIARGDAIPIGRRFKYYAHQIEKNIRNYQPPGSLPADVHLLGGSEWIRKMGRRWSQNYLSFEPELHDLGDVRHSELIETPEYRKKWIELVSDICHEQTRTKRNGLEELSDARTERC